MHMNNELYAYDESKRKINDFKALNKIAACNGIIFPRNVANLRKEHKMFIKHCLKSIGLYIDNINDARKRNSLYVSGVKGGKLIKSRIFQ